MYDPTKPHRRSIRLEGYDYANANAYFITICVNERRCLFGDVIADEMRLNDIGQMIETEWKGLVDRFPPVILDQFAVMPNHVHGIVGLDGTGGRGEADLRPLRRANSEKGEDQLRPCGTTPDSLGRVVQAFKSITTNAYIGGVKSRDWPRFNKHFWQPNYYEHIIRHNRSLDAIREYIFTNPQRWAADRENPLGDGTDDVEAFIRSIDLPSTRTGEHEVRPYGGGGAI